MGQERATIRNRCGSAASATWWRPRIQNRLHRETRCVVLGHLQRGGQPTTFDRVLATQFGAHAMRLVYQRQFGQMICYHPPLVDSVPISEASEQAARGSIPRAVPCKRHGPLRHLLRRSVVGRKPVRGQPRLARSQQQPLLRQRKSCSPVAGWAINAARRAGLRVALFSRDVIPKFPTDHCIRRRRRGPIVEKIRSVRLQAGEHFVTNMSPPATRPSY